MKKGPNRAAANPAIALRLQSLRPVRRAADLYWVVRCARNEGTYELRSE